MLISWTTPGGETREDRVGAEYLPYCEALGLDLAARLFLSFGGGVVSIRRPESKTRGSRLEKFLGSEPMDKLAAALGGRTLRVPIANAFLCRYLRSQGKNVTEIARTVRLTDTSVRDYLRTNRVRADRRRELEERKRGTRVRRWQK